MTRDYKKERRDYYGYGSFASVTKEQQKHRRDNANRKEARQIMKADGAVKKGQDVHHKNGNPSDNRRSNLKATSVHYNRSKNKH